MTKERFDQLMSIDLTQLFGYDSTKTELNNLCTYIKDTFRKPKYNSIPRQYYPFLLKLLSYKRFDYRSEYKDDDIRTFFVGTNEYGTLSIMFYDNENHCDSVGCGSALKAWQDEKEQKFDYMLKQVIMTMRNIIKPKIMEMRHNITLPTRCQITGEIINDIKDLQIDHYDKDFVEVAYNFMYDVKQLIEKENNILIDVVKYMFDMIDDNQLGFKANLNDVFLKYHDMNTHLRIVSKKANLMKEKIRPSWQYLKKNGYYIEKYDKQKKLD